ncbi:MAG: hypothetical protein U0263_07990 [Polyangiaceae bacterium]
MSRLERLGRALLSALVVSACGSRSALPEASPSSTGTGGSDGGVDPCAAPALPMQCAADILVAPAGDEVWSTELPVGNLCCSARSPPTRPARPTTSAPRARST